MKNGRGGFGSELPGNFGPLLMRGAYNSELYGPLQKEYLKGKEQGTDVWIHKNRCDFSVSWLLYPPLTILLTRVSIKHEWTMGLPKFARSISAGRGDHYADVFWGQR